MSGLGYKLRRWNRLKITNKNIIKILGESYNLIDTLTGANPWCDEVEDKVDDVLNKIVKVKRKLEEEEWNENSTN